MVGGRSEEWAHFEITNVFCDVITRHKYRLCVRHKRACDVVICEGWFWSFVQNQPSQTTKTLSQKKSSKISKNNLVKNYT
jgi:hypothetical protein